jgi:hypothetical protein
MSPSPPSSALPATYSPCRMTTHTCQPTHSRAYLRRQHECLRETVFWKILHVFRPLPARVYVYSPPGGYIFRTFSSSLFTWDLLLYPSQRASSSPPTHVCRFVCLSTPAWLHLPDIPIFAIATHSLSHICTLSNTHFFLCFHCHLWSSFSLYQTITPYIRFRN